MRINFNASAVIANNALNRNDNRLQDSLARLSSGLKVVNAKDNPSGLAMSKKMNAQIKGLDQAGDNAGDGVSIIEIADGAMSEMHDILQRINELAVKGSTGTITDDDRKLIQDEVKQLKEELTRISETVEFNGQTILDGSFDLRGYSNNQNAKVAYYSDEILAGTYTIDQLKVTYNADGTIDEVTAKNFGNGFPKDANVTSIDGNIVTIAGSGNFELKLRLTNDATFTDLDLDLEGFGAMDMQIGANEGQQLGIRIPKMSLENMGISNIDLSTAEGANEAIDKVDAAIKYVSASRSRLGAYQNRLEHTQNNLSVMEENITDAESTIRDTDVAEEMMSYTKNNILIQSAQAMLAQANQVPQGVLQLLQ